MEMIHESTSYISGTREVFDMTISPTTFVKYLFVYLCRNISEEFKLSPATKIPELVSN
jgi:hypothetical protein